MQECGVYCIYSYLEKEINIISDIKLKCFVFILAQFGYVTEQSEPKVKQQKYYYFTTRTN